MVRKRMVLIVASISLAVCCAAALSTARAASESTTQEASDSLFGVGYTPPDPRIPELWAKTGIRWMKIPQMMWKFVEPEPPVDGVHTYEWDELDNIVKMYQEHGFHLQMVVKASSSWACKPLRTKNVKGSVAENIAVAPLKDEHWDDYGEFIAALVERYDHDGVRDMPGLLMPMLHYEIESEASLPIHWQGTADEYIRLLRTAYESAKRASPDCKILLSGLNFADTFDDMPDAATVQQRLLPASDVIKRHIEFAISTLRATDYYDIIEFHYNRDYLGIYGTVEWLRSYSDKPIWAGDAASAPFLFTRVTNPYPNAKELFKRISDKQQPETDWYRAEQARLTTKKFVVAAEMGLERVIMETTKPWNLGATSPVAVDFMWDLQAMIDDDYEPFPVYYTLKLLVEKLDGYQKAHRLPTEDNIFGYVFAVGDKQVFVFWYEDRITQQPGAQQGSTAIDLSSFVNSETVKVTHIIISPNQDQPTVKNVPADGIELTETPILVEAL